MLTRCLGGNVMSSDWKQRWLRIWKRLVRFAQWCEKHGVPKMFVEFILKLIFWWLTHQ